MKKNSIFLFWMGFFAAFLNLNSSVYAQISVPFGEIPDSLFQIDFSDRFKEDYIILNKTAEVRFKEDALSIIAESRNLVRIKVLKENGLKAAVIGIPYLSYNNLEQITHVEAQSFDGHFFVRLDTMEIKKIKINDRISFIEFQIPGAKVGSVIEYQYRIERRFIEELPVFYFQENVPVLQAQFAMRQAPYIRYKSVVQHEVVPVSKKLVEVDTSTGIKLFTRRQPEPIRTNYWIAENIPALKAEPFVLSETDFRMQLRSNWSEFGIPLQVIEANWDLVSAELSKEKGLEANIQKASRWHEWGRDTTLLIGNQQKALEAIFNKIKKMAAYNQQSSLLSTTNPDSLWEQPIQDGATINQALIAALRGAGFSAYPVFTTPVHSSDLRDVYPTKYQFEKLLAGVQQNDTFIFLDATDPFAHVNMIPADYVNQRGFVLKGFKNYQWVQLRNEASIFSQQIFVKGDLSTKGTLKAHVSGTARGYLSRDIREKMANKIDLRDHFKSTLFSRYFNVKISPVEIKADAADSLSFSFDFTLENAASRVDKGLLFKPLFISYLDANPFNKETRNLPVQFKTNEVLVTNVLIKVPKSYHSRSKPAILDYGFGGAYIKWQQFNSRDIDYRFDVQLNQLDFKPELYPNIKRLYDLWQEWSSAEIVIFKP